MKKEYSILVIVTLLAAGTLVFIPSPNSSTVARGSGSAALVQQNSEHKKEKVGERRNEDSAFRSSEAAALVADAAQVVAARSVIQSTSAFEELEEAANTGDAAAMRHLSEFGRECEDILFLGKSEAALIRMEDQQMSAREEIALLNEQKRKLSVCEELGSTRIRGAYNRMLDAALAGDDLAQLRLRHYPPRAESDTPYTLDEWRDAVVAVLNDRRNDPEAMYQLAEVYRSGVAGEQNIPEAMSLLRRVLEIAPPASDLNRRAARRLELLNK